MNTLPEIFKNNEEWAASMVEQEPDFFKSLAGGQAPKCLWIGCADSRVPATQITGLKPGELFVHRNVANVVSHTDFNMLSVLQYAVDVLKVEHVIICGHYGCGGVAASVDGERHGIVDHWIKGIGEMAERQKAELEGLEEQAKWDRLCELNVEFQAENMSRTTVIEDAWARGQKVEIHSWIYGLKDGRLKSLADPKAS